MNKDIYTLQSEFNNAQWRGKVCISAYKICVWQRNHTTNNAKNLQYLNASPKIHTKRSFMVHSNAGQTKKKILSLIRERILTSSFTGAYNFWCEITQVNGFGFLKFILGTVNKTNSLLYYCYIYVIEVYRYIYIKFCVIFRKLFNKIDTLLDNEAQ